MSTSQPSWSNSGSFFIFPTPDPHGLYLGTAGGRSCGFPSLYPQELTQHTLRCRTPHPDQELLCQDDTQPENLSKCHIGLSSYSSCLSLSFSYSFVINGLGGK